MICKTKGKTALFGELMGKAGALPTFYSMVAQEASLPQAIALHTSTSTQL